MFFIFMFNEAQNIESAFVRVFNLSMLSLLIRILFYVPTPKRLILPEGTRYAFRFEFVKLKESFYVANEGI